MRDEVEAAWLEQRDHLPASLLWNAIVRDAALRLCIVSRAHRLIYASEATLRAFGDSLDACVGRPVWHADKDFMRERLAHIERVIDSGATCKLVQLIGGVLHHNFIRRIDDIIVDGAPCGMVVSVPAIAQHFEADDGLEVFYARHHDMGPLARLSPREIQVLRLIGLGLSTNEIARRLHRSPKTVEGHRFSLGQKLEASSRGQLVRVALHAGLCTLDEDPDDPELPLEPEWLAAVRHPLPDERIDVTNAIDPSTITQRKD
ncbi:MAG: response regulator transcription factor [Phycisphaerales bacterium]